MNKENTHHAKERVQVYVDGFNLYFGMLEAGFDYCKRVKPETVGN